VSRSGKLHCFRARQQGQEVVRLEYEPDSVLERHWRCTIDYPSIVCPTSTLFFPAVRPIESCDEVEKSCLTFGPRPISASYDSAGPRKIDGQTIFSATDTARPPECRLFEDTLKR